MAEVGARKLRLADESRGGPEDLVGEYLATLGGRSVSTVEAYGRILRSLAGRVSERPGGSAGFRPELLTRTAVGLPQGAGGPRNGARCYRVDR